MTQEKKPILNQVGGVEEKIELTAKYWVDAYFDWFKNEGTHDYEKALECFEKALKIDPEYARAWRNKGWALGKYEKNQEAIECYIKALEIDEKDRKEDSIDWFKKELILGELGKQEIEYLHQKGILSIEEIEEYFKKAAELRKEKNKI